MKRILPLILALIFLAACGDATVEPTTPSPATANPEAIHTSTPTSAPDSDGSSDNPYGLPDWALEDPQLPYPQPGKTYFYTSEHLDFTVRVPAEVANAVSMIDGYEGWVDERSAVSCVYMPGIQEGAFGGCLYAIMRVPRRELFSSGNWFFHEMVDVEILAMGRDYAYLYLPRIGGSDVPRRAMLGAYRTHELFGIDYLRENMRVKSQDCIPTVDMDSLLSTAQLLKTMENRSLTRAEAAQLIYDFLDADNKDVWYTIEYNDIWIGTEHGKAIAYLASYGMFSPDTEFNPDKPITRAEFLTLLQRALLYLNITWYGYPVEANDIDDTHWAWNVLNRAWQDGWIAIENGDIRPDEPITADEMSIALNGAYDFLTRKT